MSKLGEINYLRNIGVENVRHAVEKPFSDPACDVYLAEVSAVMALLPAPPATLLDLGCGTGWTSAFLAKRGYEVVGVDIAPDMITHANRRRDAEGIDNLRFVESDYEDLDAAASFDCALFYHALHHALDERQALRCAFDSLKAGGACVVCEPGEGHARAEESRRAVERFDVTEKDMPPAKVIALAREVGFRKAEVFPHVRENRLVDYALGSAIGFGHPVEDPLRQAGWLKRLFHRLVRARLGIPREVYPAFIAELPRLAVVAERLQRLRAMTVGIVVLTK